MLDSNHMSFYTHEQTSRWADKVCGPNATRSWRYAHFCCLFKWESDLRNKKSHLFCWEHNLPTRSVWIAHKSSLIKLKIFWYSILLRMPKRNLSIITISMIYSYYTDILYSFWVYWLLLLRFVHATISLSVLR